MIVILQSYELKLGPMNRRIRQDILKPLSNPWLYFKSSRRRTANMLTTDDNTFILPFNALTTKDYELIYETRQSNRVSRRPFR